MRAAQRQFPASGRRGWLRWWWLLLLLPLVLGSVLLLGYQREIHLQPQDTNIAAPAGAPGPKEPCFQGKPTNSPEGLISRYQNGVKLARIEPQSNVYGTGLGSMSDSVYVRYSGESAHVVYMDQSQNFKGFRLSTETFHANLVNDKGSILVRVREIGSSLPSGQLRSLDTLSQAMDFLTWPNFVCRPL